MFDECQSFVAEESAVVAADWVVLTAACVGLALAGFALISQAAQDGSELTSAVLSAFEPGTDGFLTEQDILDLYNEASTAAGTTP